MHLLNFAKKIPLDKDCDSVLTVFKAISIKYPDSKSWVD